MTSTLASPARPAPPDALALALRAARGALLAAFAFACVVNLLMLTGPVFMLQVYDRVLTSRSVPTLVALMAFAALMYAFLGVFDFLRARVMSRLAQGLDARLGSLTLRRWMGQGGAGAGVGAGAAEGGPTRPLAELAVLRNFLTTPAVNALMDLPWMPLYLLLVFGLHWSLGALAAGGALVAVVLALLTEALTRRPAAIAAAADHHDAVFAEQSQRNVETLLAMGMVGATTAHWQSLHDAASASSQAAAERVEWLSSLSRAFRLLLQSAILGLGGYLAIRQQLSAGAIVAASIIAGRALAPIDQLIGGWRGMVRARSAHRRLTLHLRGAGHEAPPIQLPAPVGALQVQGVAKRSPLARPGENRRPLLEGLNFALEPGSGLGVIGPSACGKTSLARLLTGVWRPDAGTVRLDGATFEQWAPDQVGRHIGYLPQTVELMAGTLRDNIARFDAQATDDEVIAAAQLAGVHPMILALPEGYATRLGPGGTVLSGGQVQRIGLARAVFRRPALVVLDEPNANLDAEGDDRLTQAIHQLREGGSTVVVMAHRPSAIAAVDLILMLDNGRQTAFGPKAEVLRKVARVASA
ncbi:MAG: ABC transporter ATP-binding protein [Burkholderiales bacterium RIFCSPHIGHO2_12_FULL_69_20]|nr:MAG: ABC transporter ATP-binding protein [Burkholderiales bacterium RIFCSPHIGHO2_12_FULL_69_20]